MVQAAGVPDFKLIKTSIFLLTITLDWHRMPCMLCYKGVYTHRYDPSVSSPASTYLCRLTAVLSDVLPAESVPCWWLQDWKEPSCRSDRDRQKYLARFRLVPRSNSPPILTEPPTMFGLKTFSMLGRVVTVLQVSRSPIANDTPRYWFLVWNRLGASAPEIVGYHQILLLVEVPLCHLWSRWRCLPELPR